MRDQRIIKKDLVYIIGLSQRLAKKDILTQPQFFGQYGKIRKIIVNKDKPFTNGNHHTLSYSAYITFNDKKEASLAILSVDGYEIDQKIIKASFGMTKYCSYFVNNNMCKNSECLYLHEFAKREDCFGKDDEIITKKILKVDPKSIIEDILKGDQKIIDKGPEYKDYTKDFKLCFPPINVALKKIQTFFKDKEMVIQIKKKSKNKTRPIQNLKQDKNHHIVHELKSISKWSDDSVADVKLLSTNCLIDSSSNNGSKRSNTNNQKENLIIDEKKSNFVAVKENTNNDKIPKKGCLFDKGGDSSHLRKDITKEITQTENKVEKIQENFHKGDNLNKNYLVPNEKKESVGLKNSELNSNQEKKVNFLDQSADNSQREKVSVFIDNTSLDGDLITLQKSQSYCDSKKHPNFSKQRKFENKTQIKNIFQDKLKSDHKEKDDLSKSEIFLKEISNNKGNEVSNKNEKLENSQLLSTKNTFLDKSDKKNTESDTKDEARIKKFSVEGGKNGTDVKIQIPGTNNFLLERGENSKSINVKEKIIDKNDNSEIINKSKNIDKVVKFENPLIYINEIKNDQSKIVRNIENEKRKNQFKYMTKSGDSCETEMQLKIIQKANNIKNQLKEVESSVKNEKVHVIQNFKKFDNITEYLNKIDELEKKIKKNHSDELDPIENILKNRPNEFTELDKKIIETLKKSINNIQRENSRYDFAKIEVKEQNRNIKNIKNLIKTFLDPIPEVFNDKKNKQEKIIYISNTKDDCNTEFRLFNQSYTLKLDSFKF